MSKANKSIAMRGTAFLLSILLCLGCIGTNWMGLVPGSSEGITGTMNAYAETGGSVDVYYDVGTVTMSTTGSTVTATSPLSLLSGEDAVTLDSTGATSFTWNLWGRDDDVDGNGNSRNDYTDYKAALPNGTYHYVAEGRASAPDANGDVSVAWTIYAWPASTSDAGQQGTSWPAGAATMDTAKSLWDAKKWLDFAPVWESGNAGSYYDWTEKGSYNFNSDAPDVYGANGNIEYGSSALIWSGNDGVFWSVINTEPVKWHIDQNTWETDGSIDASKHVAVVDTSSIDTAGGMFIQTANFGASNPKYNSSDPDWAQGINFNSAWAAYTSEGSSSSSGSKVNSYIGSGNIYGTQGGSNFADYLNNAGSTSGGDTADPESRMWTLPAFDTPGGLLFQYTNFGVNQIEKVNGTLTVGKSDTTGALSSVTLNDFNGSSAGVRVYGLEMSVFAQPGNIWYGLGNAGNGEFAYATPNDYVGCYRAGGVTTMEPWAPAPAGQTVNGTVARYPGISCGNNGNYMLHMLRSSYAHGYTRNDTAAKAIFVMDGTDPHVATGGANGLQSFASVQDMMKETSLYDGYDEYGYKTSSTNLDDEGDGTMVNSHLPFEIRTQLFFDITTDGQRVDGTATGVITYEEEPVIPGAVTLDTKAVSKTGSTADVASVITDTITYHNLQDGEAYTLTSEVYSYDAFDASHALKVGSTPVSTKTYTLHAVDGTTNPTSALTGTTTVALNGTLVVDSNAFDSVGDPTVSGVRRYVARETLVGPSGEESSATIVHGDTGTKSTAQVVSFTHAVPGEPVLTTSAISGTSKGTDIRYVNPVVGDKISDTVMWTNFDQGTYVVESALYDVSSNMMLPGTVQTSAPFTADSATTTGTFDVSWTLTSDMLSTLTGTKDIAVVQRAYVSPRQDGDAPVATHNTAYDVPEQIVHVQSPTIKTNLTNGTINGTVITATSGTSMEPTSNTVIVDTIDYDNLVPGNVYKVRTTIVDKATGETLSDSSGTKSVFVGVISPSKTSYTALMGLQFKNMETVLRGKTVVAYNELFLSLDGDMSATIRTTNDILVEEERDLNNAAQTFTFLDPSGPTLATMAHGDGNSKTIPAAANTVIIDEVTYSGLETGKSYILRGTLYDKTSGTTLNVAPVQTVFTAANGSTILKQTFTLDTSNMKGKQIVVFEEVLLDNKVIASHIDINDALQTVTVESPATPILDTLARGVREDGTYSSTYVINARNAEIDDIVYYWNLVPGQTYTLTGTLYDRDTGRVLAGSQTVTRDFTPNSATGSVVMTFTLDTTALSGRRLVVGEVLSSGNSYVAEHTSMTDNDQTLRVMTPDDDDPDDPYITTTAFGETGQKTVDCKTDAKIRDTVQYFNLVAGQSYVLRGELRDAITGARIAGTTTTDYTFVAASGGDGTAEVTFTVDTTQLAGRKIVVYETLYRNNTVVCSHTDLTDAGQTVTVNTPVTEVENGSITTVALDTTTGGHTLILSTGASITDTVSYTGLTGGKQYTLQASVYDRATGQQAVGIAPVSTKFTAASGGSGSTSIIIPVDTTVMTGKTLVVYEAVMDGDRIVCTHQDLNDANQTVYVAAFSTVLTGADSNGKTVAASTSAKLNDMLSFSGLTPGRNYTVTGYIIDTTGAAVQPQTQTTSTQAQTPATQTPTPDTTPDMSGMTGTGSGDGETSIQVGDDGDTTPPALTPDWDGEDPRVDVAHRDAAAQVLTLPDGSQVYYTGEIVAQGTASFTPTTSSGSANVAFNVDTSGRNGHNLVCLEVITDNGSMIGSHADINDANQTVTVRTSVNVQTGVSNFGLWISIMSVLLMLGCGAYTVQAVINRKRFGE